MGYIKFYHIFLIILVSKCSQQNVPELAYSAEEENIEMNVIDLRRELDKMTQELLMKQDPLYHSYVSNSGVGNREELGVDWMEQRPQLFAVDGAVNWQAVQSVGQIYLLGQRKYSVSLVTGSSELSINGSANLLEFSINFEDNVLSTSIFTKWDLVSDKPEVIVVVSTDSPSSDIIFYRVIDGKLELIKKRNFYRKINCISTVVLNKKSHLIIVEKGPSAVINVFDIILTPDNSQLDFRLVQSFNAQGEIRSLTVSRVGIHNYLVLTLPHLISVYLFESDHYKHHTDIAVPQVSKVISFSVALQTYLAISGETSYLLRVTEEGEFISEFMIGHFTEWLVVSIYTYRSDVLLFSRNGNVIEARTWSGTSKGFSLVETPQCDSCLEGNWSGAVVVPFHNYNCLLIPQLEGPPNLVTFGTSLHVKDPVLDKLKATIASVNNIQNEWQSIESKMLEIESALKHVVKKKGVNVVTGKWIIGKLESPELRVNSLVHSEVNSSSEVSANDVDEEPLDINALEHAYIETVQEGEKLIQAVKGREEEVWGLDGFRGKVTFKGRLVVDNLKVSYINNHPIDDLLQNTFRKDRQEQIHGNVVVKSLQAEDIRVNKINDFTKEKLKFLDQPLVIQDDVTFEKVVTVQGNVELKSGFVNDVNLSTELCEGSDHCTVFPLVNISEEMRSKDLDNTFRNPSPGLNDFSWAHVIAGKNLTVLKINGVDWNTLTENVIYKDIYQNISGTMIVRGKVSIEKSMWAGSVEDSVGQASGRVPSILDPMKRPPSSDGKVELFEKLFSASKVTISELEVTGSVKCDESEWGDEASDVVLRDMNPVNIEGYKEFVKPITVTNNLEVKGTVAGLYFSDLLTKDTDQIFDGPTTLHGNITMENVTVSQVLSKKNFSVPASDTYDNEVSDDLILEIIADEVNVLETLNDVRVADFVFTDEKNITKVESMSVERINITKDITVEGEVCNVNINDFDRRRLSLLKEQDVTGQISINNAIVNDISSVEKLNGIEIDNYPWHKNNETLNVEKILLSELVVEGDILTDHGVNGYNLTSLSAEAVWLQSNNDIDGHLIFKDEVTFDHLDCQGYCNDHACSTWFDTENIVFQTNETVKFSGKMKFFNHLNISEDLTVNEINGNKVEDILTKTLDQEIYGDIFIDGSVTISEDSFLFGLLNNLNVSEFGQRCAVSGDRINCKGDIQFNGDLMLDNFNSSGNINGINFDEFMLSVIRINNPQEIKGFKHFNAVNIENIVNVELINGENWNNFLSETIKTDSIEHIMGTVVFTEKLTISEMSVDKNLDSGTICGVDLNDWKTESIYINGSHAFKRPIRLDSASSLGSIQVVNYNGVHFESDVVKLHGNSNMNFLNAETVTILDGIIIVSGRVNKQKLEDLHTNTLKVSGHQTVHTDLVLTGDIIINGSLTTLGHVSHHNLKNLITLNTDQTLFGKYAFDCVEAEQNVSVSRYMSGINMSLWENTGVLKSSDQELSGLWKVQGSLDLQGSVTGRGKLGGASLRDLTDNITRTLLDVHSDMKKNLTQACKEANRHLSRARNQPCELQYLAETQTLHTSGGLSLVSHFTSGEDNFLAVSEIGCITKVYKWNHGKGAFVSFQRYIMGSSLSQFVILYHKEFTYAITESSQLPSDCNYSGKHLWIFVDNHFKHISSLNITSGVLYEGEGNVFYSVSETGVFKYSLHIRDDKISLSGVPHNWTLGTGVFKERSAIHLEWLSEVNINCTGQVLSISVDPKSEFVAVASTENAEVPKFADNIRIYRQNGKLFDKLHTQKVGQVQWLTVPKQTWLASLQNHELKLYQLKDLLRGFELRMSAAVNATSMTTLVLPVADKVNPQSFIILKTPLFVKILRVFLQGDPYLGPDLTCSFDDILARVPRN